MTDIKELALRVADPLRLYQYGTAGIIDFAQRLLTAYLAEQKPVAQVHPNHLRKEANGGPWCREVLLYSGDNQGDLLNGKNHRVRLFTAPLEPSPQQLKPQTTIGESTDPAQPAAVCAAPLHVCQYCNQPVPFPHVCQDAKVGTLHPVHEPDFSAKVVLSAAPLPEDVKWAIRCLDSHARNVGGNNSHEQLWGSDACKIADLIERLANRAKNAINEMEIYKEENENLRQELAKKIPDGREFTDEQLTVIYNTANNIGEGKAPPITTQRIFAAMRAMISAGEKK